MKIDPILEKIVQKLRVQYRCHTIVLYGSRARGDFTEKSDYDVLGVRKSGRKQRLPGKIEGRYLDIFIYPEKDLARIGEEHLYMKGAKLLYQKGNFGNRFLTKLQQALKKRPKPLPSDELKTRQLWAWKMLERAKSQDVEGHYRRSWLLVALLEDYFYLRKKRYCGPKESFHYLKTQDPRSYRLFSQSLAAPSNLKMLEKLVQHVTRFKPPI